MKDLIKIIVVFITLIMLVGCSTIFGDTVEKVGSASLKVGQGVGIARAGKALETVSEARKVKAQVLIQAEKNKQARIESDRQKELAEIYAKKIADANKKIRDNATENKIAKVIADTKNENDRQELAILALQAKINKTNKEAEISLEKIKNEYSLDIEIERKNIDIGIAKEKYNGWLWGFFGAMVMFIIMMLLFALKDLTSKVKVSGTYG